MARARMFRAVESKSVDRLRELLLDGENVDAIVLAFKGLTEGSTIGSVLALTQERLLWVHHRHAPMVWQRSLVTDITSRLPRDQMNKHTSRTDLKIMSAGGTLREFHGSSPLDERRMRVLITGGDYGLIAKQAEAARTILYGREHFSFNNQVRFTHMLGEKQIPISAIRGNKAGRWGTTMTTGAFLLTDRRILVDFGDRYDPLPLKTPLIARHKRDYMELGFESQGETFLIAARHEEGDRFVRRLAEARRARREARAMASGRIAV